MASKFDATQHNLMARAIEKEGKKLLEATNRPNIVTVQQFMPFIELFQIDYSKVDTEFRNTPEGKRLGELYQLYRTSLSINIYEPTIVIESLENPVEVAWLDRAITRFKSDAVDGEDSARNSVPGGISKASQTTREELLVQASTIDTLSANNTPEQMREFALIKGESALIRKNFFEKNMSDRAKKLAGLLGTPEGEDGSDVADAPQASGIEDFGLDDD